MGITKPFHRTSRQFETIPNAGYSSWAYMVDRDYASSPEHYTRAVILIQDDLQSLFQYIEPSSEALLTYSYRCHALLMRTCIEIEANFKAILKENVYYKNSSKLSMSDYRKVDVTHHLSSYKLSLPIWNGGPRIFEPFKPWYQTRGVAAANHASLPWYKAYNASKHDRHDEFKQANFGSLLDAVAALVTLITSQFGTQTYGAGEPALSAGSNHYHAMKPTIGSLFRIEHPTDWPPQERYAFNWSVLKEDPVRFQKFNYDSIPN